MLKSWCRIFRGSHQIRDRSMYRVYWARLISGRLKTLIFQWAIIEARVWLHLPLFKT